MRYAHGRRRNRGPQERKEERGYARLVETLALGSVGQSTQKNYLEKWNTWIKEIKAQGYCPWLNALDGPDKVLNGLLEFIASRCFVHNTADCQRLLGGDQRFPQDVRRMRTTDVT